MRINGTGTTWPDRVVPVLFITKIDTDIQAVQDQIWSAQEATMKKLRIAYIGQ